ncbi:MAG TPA: carboxypeptidase-like regulatory domain-containing protein, partial [Actinomycetota bacterium]|nr:carboxypeptidase-like regulatory domain-containing protein [Actinomycetota bacterium]
LARLTSVALRAMPFWLAALSVGAGAAVATAGLVASAGQPAPAPAGPTPGLTLEPAGTPPPDPTPQPADGRIAGTVRTAQGTPAAGTAVTLTRFEATTEAERRETTTADDGRYTFEGLPTGPTDAYVVSAAYEQATFPSDVLVLDAERDRTVDLTVAAVTTDDSVVRVELDSTLLTVVPAGLDVLQILNVLVDGEAAFTGGLRLPILEGASGFEPRRGLSRQLLRFDDQDRLTSDAPVLPGRTEIVYGYTLPRPAERSTIVRQPDHPTDRLELLWAGDVTVDAPSLEAAGEVSVGGVNAKRYTGRDLEPGERVEVALTFEGPAGWPRTALVVGGVVVALALLLFPLVRRRQPGGTA